MRFDDRLLTVLNHPAEDRHDAAVRWRQLVDLVARAGPNSGSPVVVDALAAIRSEAERVEEPSRAAAARAVAALPLPLGLLEYFVTDSLAVSAPVLAAATLDVWQWAALHAAADEETRGFIGTLHPELRIEPRVERSPPAPQPAAQPAPRPVAQAATAPPAPMAALPPAELPQAGYAPPSLHEVVERIERRRRLRAGLAPEAAREGSEQAEAPALFRWECGPGGDIAWVEGAPRGALIGRSIAKSVNGSGDRVDDEVIRAFAMRAPFRDAKLAVAGTGAVAGEWKISGVPAFEPSDGRFAGYRGVALREAPEPVVAQEPVPDVLADPDSLRELVHEIKTPLNAIIGFAEIIENQYLGPADRGYRDRAAEIVRQAGQLLAAIDDLDFAAKVHSAPRTTRERVDLGVLVHREIPELQEIAAQNGAEIDFNRPLGEVTAGVQPELADRLLHRLFSALADRAGQGERLRVAVEQGQSDARIVVARPAALSGIPDTHLFDPASSQDGVRGGFSLRLARGLARIAGGDLISNRDSFALTFPRG